jgi:hypothetical protein
MVNLMSTNDGRKPENFLSIGAAPGSSSDPGVGSLEFGSFGIQPPPT